ncbi:MAG: radical SAM protein, partial [Myxococcota bacterium]
ALHAAGVRLSVGAVAVPEHLAAVEALRAALPAAVPLWINAQKPGPRYDADAVARWSALDPDFALDARPHRTRGRACLAGEEALHVDGDGTIHRCHFVAGRLGNLYTDDLAALLAPRPCPRAKCDCYIGYAWLPDLGLRERYGDDLVARIRQSHGQRPSS